MIKEIVKKELASYLYSPVGYVFALLLLFVSGWLYYADLFVINQAQVETLLSNMTYLLALFIPALVMGSIADEIKNGTWEVMLTTKVDEFSLVVGKFIGAFLAVGIYLLATLPAVVIISVLGKPDLGLVLASYLGLMMLVGVYVAVGIFASSLSKSSVVGFLVSSTILLLNKILLDENLLKRLPVSMENVLEKLSWSSYLSEFNAGLFRLSSVAVLLCSCAFFVALTISNLKSRNG